MSSGSLRLFSLAAAGVAALLLQAGVAQAAITQTAITSPADPSYFYDPTGGAFGAITVSGTTNSSAPATDQVDIVCSIDNGTTTDPTPPSGAPIEPVATGIPLDANGDFSTTVTYASIEAATGTGQCRLRAVPAGTTPTDISAFSGPRVLLAYLNLGYGGVPGESVGYDNVLGTYILVAPQLGAVNSFTAADTYYSYSCGLAMSLASPTYFGETASNSFDCSDTYYDAEDSAGSLSVDGEPAQTAYAGSGTPIGVSAEQNPTNGDITIHETEPLDLCTDSQSSPCAGSYYSSGVEDDRSIQQTNNGHVVLVTDTFRSTDNQAHTVSFDVPSQVDNGTPATTANVGNYIYFPNTTGFQPYQPNDNVTVGSSAPATIYAGNHTAGSDQYEAITYFTAPSAPVNFPDDPVNTANPTANLFVMPYTLNVPAGGSVSLSFAYSTEYQSWSGSPSDPLTQIPSLFNTDVAMATDLHAPVTIVITAPSAGSTTSASSVTVTGLVSAPSGVSSVSVNGVNATLSAGGFSATVPLSAGANTLTVTATTNSGVIASSSETVSYATGSASSSNGGSTHKKSWAGPVYHPIANTGGATRLPHGAERLAGSVRAGVTAAYYYFAYGASNRYGQHTRHVRLAKGAALRRVATVIRQLRAGRRYHYRLVVVATGLSARGADRTFSTAASGH
ncbi:MAG: hypothetical protein ACP5H2_10420 [Solirubrobacteraceae bacterium]